jgi:Phage portal protein
VPAADFGSDELLYLPRNARSHRLYGFSPVEQIALTVNIALRREQATLDYYNTGSIPASFATLPKDWTVDQIRQFQDYFDALMSGNLARRHMVKFMPAEFKLTETRQPPLKDMYDEWLARVICYAFSVPASAFVTQVNRATSETLRTQAAQEGLVPLKAWVKMAMDRVIAVCFGSPDCEFFWVGDDAVDPLQQAQTIAILVNAGVKTRDEARVELGLGGTAGVLKFNPYHDERGRFTDAENAVETQVADNDRGPTITDAGGGGRPKQIAQGGGIIEPLGAPAPEIEPERPVAEPPKPDIAAPDTPATAPASEPQAATSAPPSWSSPATLSDHFARHGNDFGATNASEYAEKAHDFYMRSIESGYLRKVDIDGTIRIYDPISNTFGSYNSNGTTRTFFKPSSKTYWSRQPGQ